jgi:hypothetical protein
MGGGMAGAVKAIGGTAVQQMAMGAVQEVAQTAILKPLINEINEEPIQNE